MPTVFMEELSQSTIKAWEAELAKHGMSCEFHPEFEFETWDGGFFPVKMTVFPNAFPTACRYGTKPIRAGFFGSAYRFQFPDSFDSDYLMSQSTELIERLKRAKWEVFFDEYDLVQGGARLFYFAVATLGVVTNGVVCGVSENWDALDEETAPLLTGEEAVEIVKQRFDTPKPDTVENVEEHPDAWNFEEFVSWDDDRSDQATEGSDSVWDEDIPF